MSFSAVILILSTGTACQIFRCRWRGDSVLYHPFTSRVIYINRSTVTSRIAVGVGTKSWTQKTLYCAAVAVTESQETVPVATTTAAETTTMVPRPHAAAYGNLFTIQTDTLMRDRLRRMEPSYLPEQSPPPILAPRSLGAPFRAAESNHDLTAVVAAAVAVPRGRALSTSNTVLPTFNNHNATAAVPASGPSHTPRLAHNDVDDDDFAGLVSSSSAPSSPLVASRLRRRSTLRQEEDRQYPPSQHAQHDYHVYHRYPPLDEPVAVVDDQHGSFSAQQFIQMLVLICIGYLVWDANQNVQMASSRLVQYRQETFDADARATQLYDLLHDMRKEFASTQTIITNHPATGTIKSIPGNPHNENIKLMEETRAIRQQIQNLKKQNVSVGQEVASLQGFLEHAKLIVQ